MPGKQDRPAAVRHRRRMLADEREEIRVYRDLAARRTGEEREILLALMAAEERHAAHWENALGDDVGPPRRGSPRMRLLAFMARHFGWVLVLALMQQAENRARSAPAALLADERIHAEVVRGLAARSRARMSGTLRAAVFGANDGMVSNIALVLGVIGGGAGAQTVLLTGLSGLLAGALSMAAGEYISVSSQRELLDASQPVAPSKEALAELDLEANELALVYRSRGMSAEEAARRADAVLRRGHVDTEASVDRDEVVGSALGAAWSSFAFFSTGALLPVLPFLFGLSGASALITAAVLTGGGLLLTGATVAVLSGGRPLRRALRQLAIGAGAASVTYALGLVFGAAVG